MADQNVIQALEGIRLALAGPGGAAGDIDFPRLGAGPVETVLVFNSNEHIEVRDFPEAPYFSARGVLTDLGQGDLPGSRVERTFPIDLSALPEVFRWPAPQPAPFDEPPVDGEHTTAPGPSKQAYFFGDGSSLVTVGPSLPKIAVLADGGAQFWVSSIGVVAQGTGRFAGARGLAATLGSAFFARWPRGEVEQLQLLQRGFDASVATCFKLVLARDLAGAAAPAAPSQAAALQVEPAATTAKAATDQPPPSPASMVPAAPAPAPQPPASEAPAPEAPAPKAPAPEAPAPQAPARKAPARKAPAPKAPKAPAPKPPAPKPPARKAPARKAPPPKPTPRNRP